MAGTKSTFEERLIASAREVVAIKQGRAKPSRAYSLPATANDVEVAAPRTFDSEEIVAIRKRMNLSQTVFANVLGKSAPTVRSWEQGQKRPDAAANRMLEIADKNPNVLLGFIRKPVKARKGVRAAGQRSRQR